MTIQWQYVTMFSMVWSFAPACALLNNVFELRADAAKMFFESRRPIPRKARSIGRWKALLLAEAVVAVICCSGFVVLSTGQLEQIRQVGTLDPSLSIAHHCTSDILFGDP